MNGHNTLLSAACAVVAAWAATSARAELARLCPSRLYPWEYATETLATDGAVPRPDLLNLAWCGHANSIVTPGRKVAADGAEALEWRFTVDHHDKSDYPVGWPNFEVFPKPTLDLSAGNVLSFRVRLARPLPHPASFLLILSGGKDGRERKHLRLPDLPFGEWREMHFPLEGKDWTKSVSRLHFFACECDYGHGEEVVLQFRDFRLGKTEKCLVGLSTGEVGVSLWVGARGDASSRAVLLDAGTKQLPARLHIANNRREPIPAGATVRFRLRNVITGRDTLREVPLGIAVAPGEKQAVSLAIDLAGLAPSYYHALADLLVGGASVVDIRKGSDDFLIRRPGESMAASVLLLRLGMAAWTMDRLHGGFMHSTDISLPHAYDPYDLTPAAYRAFLRRFAVTTMKVCEGYEAAMPGLALAAEAYRRAGDAERFAFAEGLLWNAAEAMLTMQDRCGGVVYSVNDLYADGLGTGGGASGRDSQYSADQTAEWMRGLVYATLYYVRKGGEAAKVKRLNAACLKAGRFLAAHTRWEEKGKETVLQNHTIALTGEGKFRKIRYRQEGRECDVYQPRVVAGMAYTAIALLKSGERVPEEWWPLFDASQAWMTQKMIANGWFDTQCGDVVEGGCHTFLGNIYLGEGLFGVAMANRLAGRTEQSDKAIAAARKAYRYVTDDCWIRGHRYQYPLEFWVGPYVYWLFTEWKRHVGPEAAFEDWLTVLDRRWSAERQWGDFLRAPGMDCGRAASNGTLVLAILGYLGIKDMDERGSPWTLFD